MSSNTLTGRRRKNEISEEMLWTLKNEWLRKSWFDDLRSIYNIRSQTLCSKTRERLSELCPGRSP